MAEKAEAYIKPIKDPQDSCRIKPAQGSSNAKRERTEYRKPDHRVATEPIREGTPNESAGRDRAKKCEQVHLRALKRNMEFWMR